MSDAGVTSSDVRPSQQYNALVEQGAGAVKEQRLQEAISAYREALGILDEQFGPDGLFSVHLCQIIASLADQVGDHAASELAYRRLLDQTRRERGEEHVDTALAMNQLAPLTGPAGRTLLSEPICIVESDGLTVQGPTS